MACNISTYTGSNTCYQWRIIDPDETKNTATIQLNFDLMQSVWNESGNNNDGPYTALSNLANATSTWTRVGNLNYFYDSTESDQNYGTLTCNDGICTISKTGTTIGTVATPVRARLITGREVANITGLDWNSYKNSSTESSFSNTWLIDNGTRNGYWTLSPVNNGTNAVRYVYYGGDFYYGYLPGSDVYLRPVITVPKTDLN